MTCGKRIHASYCRFRETGKESDCNCGHFEYDRPLPEFIPSGELRKGWIRMPHSLPPPWRGVNPLSPEKENDDDDEEPKEKPANDCE